MAKEVKMYDEVPGLIFDDWGIYYNKQERRNSMWLVKDGHKVIRVADVYKLPDFLTIVRLKMQDKVLENAKFIIAFIMGLLSAISIYLLVQITLAVF